MREKKREKEKKKLTKSFFFIVHTTYPSSMFPLPPITREEVLPPSS